MNNERITLNMKETRINDILVKLISNEISINDAVRLSGLSERQIYRKRKIILYLELALFHINQEVNLMEKDIQKNLKTKSLSYTKKNTMVGIFTILMML